MYKITDWQRFNALMKATWKYKFIHAYIWLANAQKMHAWSKNLFSDFQAMVKNIQKECMYKQCYKNFHVKQIHKSSDINKIACSQAQ